MPSTMRSPGPLPGLFAFFLGGFALRLALRAHPAVSGVLAQARVLLGGFALRLALRAHPAVSGVLAQAPIRVGLARVRRREQ